MVDDGAQRLGDGGDPQTIGGETQAQLAGDERMQAMFTLYDAIDQMLDTDSKTETVEVVLDATVEVLGLAQTGIHRHDEDERALVPVVWSGSLEDELGEPPALGPGSTAWDVYEDETTPRVENYWSEGTHHNPDTEFRSEVIVPLGEYGALLSASPEPAEFDDLDERFLEVLCANAVDAFDRLDRRDRLEWREAELARQQDIVGDLVDTLRESFDDISAAATDISERSHAIDNHSDEQAERGVEQIEQTDEQFEDIVTQITETADAIEEVATAADEQAQTIQEVSSFVDDTEEVAHTISTAAGAIVDAAREQTTQIDQMESELAETEQELQ
jgi:hypothetical protein